MYMLTVQTSICYVNKNALELIKNLVLHCYFDEMVDVGNHFVSWLES